MLTDTIRSITNATRNVFRSWRSMLLISAVYALLLALLYFFVAIKEATIAQVTLTFAFAVAAPLLFFLLQAMIASSGANVVDDNNAPAGISLTLRRSLTSFWKLLLVTLPLIALAFLIAYLLARAQNRFGTTLPDAVTPSRLAETARGAHPPRPVNWKIALFSTIRYLLFGLVLPLATIHLWLATAREGLLSAIRRVVALTTRAFAPRSVLIYVVGFVIFAVLPYFILFRTTQTKHAWIEIALLVTRLVAVFALTLFGWTITVRALGEPLPNLAKEPSEAT
jgi:hypothetical protein